MKFKTAGAFQTSGVQINWIHTTRGASVTQETDKWVQPGVEDEERKRRTNLVAFPHSWRMPGGVETLQSQQVQLRIWVVSDLMDNLEDDR